MSMLYKQGLITLYVHYLKITMQEFCVLFCKREIWGILMLIVVSFALVSHLNLEVQPQIMHRRGCHDAQTV